MIFLNTFNKDRWRMCQFSDVDLGYNSKDTILIAIIPHVKEQNL